MYVAICLHMLYVHVCCIHMYVVCTCMLYVHACCMYMHVVCTCMLYVQATCMLYVHTTCMLYVHVCCIASDIIYIYLFMTAFDWQGVKGKEETALDSAPTFIELLGFAYFPPSLMTGPQISFKKYKYLTEGLYDQYINSW